MNDEGNITLPALFATGFLIGGLWYLVGLGDAMLYHQSMQDAADATSFAPSVLQARGMNVLALVNLVMSAILAVLVAVKIVQLLLLAANVMACAIPFDPYCPMLSSWESPVSDFVKVADRTVSTVNKGLHGAETAMAKTVPVVAQTKAEAASHAYAPIVESGFFASPSLVPGSLEGTTRVGLPVEDEKYENLCLQASADLKNVIFQPLRFLPGANAIVAPVQKLAGGLVDQLLKAFPSWFCGSGGGLASLGESYASIAKDGIEKVASKVCKEAMHTAPTGTVPGMGGDRPLDLASCTSGVGAGASSIAGGSLLGGSEQTSKRIFHGATMGGDYFASYGMVYSRWLSKNDVDERLRTASWDALPQAGVDALMTQIQVSKSEMYFEPKTSTSEPTLLDMRWRARLRRHRPGELAPLMIGTGMGSIVSTVRGGSPSMSPEAILDVVLGRSPESLGVYH